MYRFVSANRVEVKVGGSEVTLEYIPVGWIREIQAVVKSRLLRNMMNDTELSLVAHVWKGKPHLLVGGRQVPIERSLEFLDNLAKIMIDMRQTTGVYRDFEMRCDERLTLKLVSGYLSGSVPPMVYISHGEFGYITALPIPVIEDAAAKMKYDDWWGCDTNIEMKGISPDSYAKIRSTTSGMLAISLTEGDRVEVWHFTVMEFIQLMDFLKIAGLDRDHVMGCLMYRDV